MKTSAIVVICLAVVLVIGAVVAGIDYGVSQSTIRQNVCVDHGGTYYDGHCFYPKAGS